jgi:hypothetical protein
MSYFSSELEADEPAARGQRSRFTGAPDLDQHENRGPEAAAVR